MVLLKKKTKREREAEGEIRALSGAFEKRGVKVRREKLSRGYSYRVKSGGCVYSGENHVFIDRRLPLERQVSLLLDSLVERNFKLSSEEVALLSKPSRSILETRFGA